MSVIAVFNQTDGVGKTTTSVNLLAGIAQRKLRPLGIDLDPQAHLSSAFGAHPSPAEDSVYAFFAEQRSLAEIAQITKSGVVLCPAHVDLAQLDRRIGRGVAAVTRLRLALSAPEATPTISHSKVRSRSNARSTRWSLYSSAGFPGATF